MTKKKQSNIIKNVLADPYDSFWPHIEGDQQEIISDNMKSYLPLAKLHKGFISHKNLRAIHREKSKERRKELWKSAKVPSGVPKEEISKNRENRKALLLGVNSVSRAIEHSKVACCVVCGDSSSRPLVQHVVMSAAQKRVPVIVLNDLRQKTDQYLGHPCAVFALKKEVSQNKEHLFHPLYEVIKSSAQKFSIPEQLMNPSSDDESVENDTKEEEQSKIKLEPIRKFVYLTRNSSSRTRVFVPKSVIRKQSTIGFGDYTPLSLDVNDKIDTENSDAGFSYLHSYKMSDGDDDHHDDDDDDTTIDTEGRDLFFIDKVSRPPINLKRKMKHSQKFKPLAVKRLKGNPKKTKKNKKKI